MEQPGYTKPEAQRGLGLQILIAFSLGFSSLLLFSFWRKRWPQRYEARRFRRLDLPPLSTSLLGWIPQLVRLGDADVLRFAGLDAYVYLAFFRLAIEILLKLSLVSLFFIAPLRWFYLGQFDDNDQETPGLADKKRPNMFGDYIWVYLASTYIFTIICLWTMRQYNYKVVSVRQAYLGHQNSLTDRTLRISGIPKKLRSEDELMKYVTILFGTEPESVMLCRKWDRLDRLVETRRCVLRQLERVWAQYIGPDNPVFQMDLRARGDHDAANAPRTSTPRYFDDISTQERYDREYNRSGEYSGTGEYDGSYNGTGNGDHQADGLNGEREFSESGSSVPGSGSSVPGSGSSVPGSGSSVPGSASPLDQSGHHGHRTGSSNIWDLDLGSDLRVASAKLFPDRPRPLGRPRLWGLLGDKVDLLEHYGRRLVELDRHITEERQIASSRPATNMAFVTMKTVAHCQLAAQCIFSPRPHTMVNSLAPAPNDIIWKNVYLHSKQRSTYNYVISLVVLVTNVFLVYPLTFLARLLDLDYISKHLPQLGDWLSQRKWMAALVTDVLPTFLVSSFNLVIPYFFAWLTVRQGLVSKSDVQLSLIAKNFFYVFVNLFLVFTLESTFLSFSVDKLAKDFAHWLIRLSSFYTNLIILQGIGLTPLKLLQTGMLFQFPFLVSTCTSAREHYNLYKPQKLNYGLALPMPMLIFIVTLTYSILRRRILFFGLVYFAANYFVYKYQLLYSMVYLHHSNAQLWSVIIRRMYLGIAVFHLAMAGVLVLQSEYTFAVMIAPLSLALVGFWYDFERFTQPLLEFVAIEALRQNDIDNSQLGTYNLQDGASSFNDGDESTELDLATIASTAARASPHASGDSAEILSSLWDTSAAANVDSGNRTLDEMREESQEYVNKSVCEPLDGPWVAANTYECVVANPDGFQLRPISQAEWL